jgi:hypothetical protein
MQALLCLGFECEVSCHDRGEDLSRPESQRFVISQDISRQDDDICVLPFHEIAPLSEKAYGALRCYGVCGKCVLHADALLTLIWKFACSCPECGERDALECVRVFHGCVGSKVQLYATVEQ